jgi:hypothetical protein
MCHFLTASGQAVPIASPGLAGLVAESVTRRLSSHPLASSLLLFGWRQNRIHSSFELNPFFVGKNIDFQASADWRWSSGHIFNEGRGVQRDPNHDFSGLTDIRI